MTSQRRPSRTTWPIALLAMLALCVQALIPAAAMAYEATSGQTMVICTVEGAKTVTVDDQQQPKPEGFAGLPCYQCVAASLAVTDTPDLLLSQPALYVARVETTPPLARRGMAPARAPPRPPGQGPPSFPKA